jgi:alpha-tubulin suppressor-like RCC1 family protein
MIFVFKKIPSLVLVFMMCTIFGCVNKSTLKIKDFNISTSDSGTTITPPSAALSSVLADLSSVAADGTAHSTIAVTLKDASGNPVVGDVIFLNSNRGILDLILPVFALTDSSGKASFTVRSMSAGAAVFSATETLNNVPITQNANVNFLVGAVSTIKSTMMVSSSSVVADNLATSTLSVTLKDSNNNPVAGKAISITANPNTDAIISPSFKNTDNSGVATFTVQSGAAGTVTFTASDTTDNLTIAQTVDVIFLPASVSASQSSVSASLTSVIDNGTSTSKVMVILTDANGNPFPGRSVTLASSRGLTDTITPASGTSNASGLVTFTVKSTLAGTSTFFATDTTDMFNVISIMPSVAVVNFIPGPAALISINNGNNQSATVNSSLTNPLIVKVTDSTGNAVTGATVNWAVATGAGNLSGATSTTNSSGLAQIIWTLGQVSGANTATGTINGTTTSVIFSGTGTPGATTYFMVSGFTSPANAGTSYNFTVRAKDTYGNTTPAYAGTAAFTSSDASAILPTNSTLTSGVGSFNATLNKVNGTQTITATDIITSSITGYQSGITVLATATTPTHLYISGASNVLNDGACRSLTVTSENNTDTSALAISPININLSGNGLGTFYFDNCLTSTTTIQIPAGQSSKTFSYRNPYSENGFVLIAQDVTDVLASSNFALSSQVLVDKVFNGYSSDGTYILLNSGSLLTVGSSSQTNTLAMKSTPIPLPVKNLAGQVKSVANSYYHSCALLTNGLVQCWVNNSSSTANSKGALGNGTLINSMVPVTVTGITTASAIAVGSEFSCALLTDQTVKCWGLNNHGQLGNNSITDSSVPVSVAGISTAIAVTAGRDYACALLASGSISCWGGNYFGMLGRNTITPWGTPNSTAVNVSNISTAVAVMAGTYHTCALLSDNTVQCWGYNYYGQLGNNSGTNSSIPVPVSNISSATALAIGDSHSCVLLSDHSVQCWGNNMWGQLGNNSIINSSIPVPVSNIGNAASISSGSSSVCAKTSLGSVQCWGNNGTGQLGIGTSNTSTLTPTPMIGLTVDTATQLLLVDGMLNYSLANIPTLSGCQSMSVIATSSTGGLARALSSNTIINLSVSGDSGLSYYSDSLCTNIINTVTIPKGESATNVYFTNRSFFDPWLICGNSPTAILSAQSQDGTLLTSAPLYVQFGGSGGCSGGD